MTDAERVAKLITDHSRHIRDEVIEIGPTTATLEIVRYVARLRQELTLLANALLRVTEPDVNQAGRLPTWDEVVQTTKHAADDFIGRLVQDGRVSLEACTFIADAVQALYAGALPQSVPTCTCITNFICALHDPKPLEDNVSKDPFAVKSATRVGNSYTLDDVPATTPVTLTPGEDMRDNSASVDIVDTEALCKNCGRKIAQYQVAEQKIWMHQLVNSYQTRTVVCPGFVAEPSVKIYG